MLYKENVQHTSGADPTRINLGICGDAIIIGDQDNKLTINKIESSLLILLCLRVLGTRVEFWYDKVCVEPFNRDHTSGLASEEFLGRKTYSTIGIGYPENGIYSETRKGKLELHLIEFYDYALSDAQFNGVKNRLQGRVDWNNSNYNPPP